MDTNVTAPTNDSADARGHMLDMPCRCCGKALRVPEEDACDLCATCYKAKGGDTDAPCHVHVAGTIPPPAESDSVETLDASGLRRLVAEASPPKHTCPADDKPGFYPCRDCDDAALREMELHALAPQLALALAAYKEAVGEAKASFEEWMREEGLHIGARVLGAMSDGKVRGDLVREAMRSAYAAALAKLSALEPAK